MKSHNGMRPQDVVILLKILTLADQQWQNRDLSTSLFISTSEISESLNRSSIAGLYEVKMRQINRLSLMEFISFGLAYVFPQVPGAVVTGVKTAHSHPFYQEKLVSNSDFVWPSSDGPARGQAIQPLHKGVPQAALMDPILYLLLASIDILRVGRAREKNIAIDVLKKYLT